MQEPSRPIVDAETIRRMASEAVRIRLMPADVDPIRTTLASLLDEISRIAPSDRAGVEPQPTVVVEEWPR